MYSQMIVATYLQHSTMTSVVSAQLLDAGGAVKEH